MLERCDELKTWIAGYNKIMDVLWSDHVLLTNRDLKPPARIQFCVDWYDVIRYCWTSAEVSQKITAPKMRVFLRNYAARACLFHGLPLKSAPMLLPPYAEEHREFLKAVLSRILKTPVRGELLHAALSGAIGKKIISLAEQLEASQPTKKENKKYNRFIEEIGREFEDIVAFVLDEYPKVLYTLNNLWQKKRLIELPDYIKATYFEDMETRIIEMTEGSKPIGRNEKNLLEQYTTIFEKFSVLRPQLRRLHANERDTRSLTMVKRANNDYIDKNVLFLLVSGAVSMNKAVNILGDEALISTPIGETTSLLRPLEVFYAYLTVAPSIRKTWGSDYYDPGLLKWRTVVLSEIEQEREKIEAFRDLERNLERSQFYCEEYEKQEADDQPCKNLHQCLFADPKLKEWVKVEIGKCEKMRTRYENIRLTFKHHPLLAPHYEHILGVTGERTPRGNLRILISHFRDTDVWRSRLEEHIGDAEKQLYAGVAKLVGIITPFSEDIAESLAKEFISAFWEFPYFIEFANEAIQKVTGEIVRLAHQVSHPPSEDQMKKALIAFIKETQSATTLSNEKDLIIVLILFAYRKWRLALTLASALLDTQEEHDYATHELRYLLALSHMYMYRENQDKSVRRLRETLAVCEQGERENRRDARFYDLHGTLLRYLFDDKRSAYSKTPLPAVVAEVTRIYDMGILCAEKSQRQHLRCKVLDHKAYFLGRYQGERELEEAQRLIEEILQVFPDRTQWHAAWLHTYGYIMLQKAKFISAKDDFDRIKTLAIDTFRMALERVFSRDREKLIKRDLAQADRLKGP